MTEATGALRASDIPNGLTRFVDLPVVSQLLQDSISIFKRVIAIVHFFNGCACNEGRRKKEEGRRKKDKILHSRGFIYGYFMFKINLLSIKLGFQIVQSWRILGFTNSFPIIILRVG
jgi:hypothetical protein